MCQALLNDENITEGIESALPRGSDSDSTEITIDLLTRIQKLRVA